VTETAVENRTLVDEVVAALTASDDAVSASSSLHAAVQRAKREYDENTLESFTRSLVRGLAENQSLPMLEALVIVGLAHPRAFSLHRINLIQEGRRLAHLLEANGAKEKAQSLLEILAAQAPDDRNVDQDLASLMRRSGNAELLIERYLKRAQDLVSGPRPLEAIPWLQEVLLVDRTRRDVARMIRDLRYAQQEKKKQVVRRLRVFGVVALIVAAVGSVVVREASLARAWSEIPPARANDLASLNARVLAIDAFQEGQRLWHGMFAASRERRDLRAEIMRIEAGRAAEERESKARRDQQIAQAEAERLNGRQYAEQSDFARALAAFRSALAVAPADWEGRARVEEDVRAISQWLGSAKEQQESPQ
jgi:tetratricopeptide (TPR) repeat protein